MFSKMPVLVLSYVPFLKKNTSKSQSGLNLLGTYVIIASCFLKWYTILLQRMEYWLLHRITAYDKINDLDTLVPLSSTTIKTTFKGFQIIIFLR